MTTHAGFDLGVDNKWLGLSPVNNDEWIELLNGINVHELLEESPSKKKPYLGLLLKKKEASTSWVFKDSTKPSQIDKQSKVGLSVTRSEYDSRVVQPKKPHHCLPLKTETEASKVLKILLTPKSHMVRSVIFYWT